MQKNKHVEYIAFQNGEAKFISIGFQVNPLYFKQAKDDANVTLNFPKERGSVAVSLKELKELQRTIDKVLKDVADESV